jgi:hypothetical protein
MALTSNVMPVRKDGDRRIHLMPPQATMPG